MIKFTRKQVQNRKRWVDALRSGRYRQTRGALRDRANTKNEAFCCLGVMCDVHNSKLWHNEKYGFTGYDSLPPYSVWSEFLIVHSDDEELSFYDGDYANMNDELNLTFDEIADIIVIETIERNGKW